MRRPSLQQLERRFDRLRQLQNRIKLPAAKYFEAFGRRYPLPLRAKCAGSHNYIPQRALEFLAGFFDGDGCVTCRMNRSGCELSVTQSHFGVGVLLLFRNLLGGGVYLEKAAVGMQKPALRWAIAGEGGRHAARLLSSTGCCKRHELRIASSWPQDHSARLAAALELRRLKDSPPTARCPSWSYLAGLFDAEGCISLRAPQYIHLSLDQKSLGVLLAVKTFLHESQIPCTLPTSSRRKCHSLRINSTGVSRLALRKLISAGLRVKRRSAQVVLQMSRANFHEVRSSLQGLVGNQGMYQRLSRSGIERALEIRSIWRRLKATAGDRQRELPIQKQLDSLKRQHEYKCAEEKCLLIRQNVRSLLLARDAA
ncbi:USP [Symbiodinium natans]|uniref:USP protein n=1 Tax=Symbiodinium natans TaxID=878477 RepID=A0A812RTU3_9DINO|nr:USP [Symbiodinium natans]